MHLRMVAMAMAVGSAAMLCAQPAVARDKRSNEDSRLEILRSNLSSGDPRAYCEAALTLQPRGFYPYCSGVTYPSTGHSFTVAAGVKTLPNSAPLWRQEGGQWISIGATAREAKLIGDAKAAIAQEPSHGCLQKGVEECIAFLTTRFLITTAKDSAFWDRSASASFDTEKNRGKVLYLQIVLPHTDLASYVQDWGWRDTSPQLDVVGIQAFVQDGVVKSIRMSGRYPILSDNPNDYQGSGFAALMGNLFPQCEVADETAFYQSFWAALVKPKRFTEDGDRWKVTGSGVSKSSTSLANDTVCGMEVGASTSAGQTFTDQGRHLYTFHEEVTFRLP